MRFAITLPRSLALLFGLLCAAASAPAQERDAELYVARGVAVEATAESAAQARDAAIAEGQRRALEVVLRRLTPPEAHDRLPRVDGAALASLVEGFFIERERASARRYLAELTVEFRPAAVRELLRGVGAAAVDRRPPRLLVVPVLQEDGRAVMFDDPNPWRDAWAKIAAAGEGLTPLVLPLGDIEDVAAVSPEQAIAGDEATLSALARRHGAQRWAVAVARPEADGVNVTLRRPDGTEVETVRGAPDAVLAEAASRLARRLDDQWRRTLGSLASQPAGGFPLSARATFSSLAEWLALRERLSRNPAVTRLDVAALSAADAQLVLHHRGGPEQLAQALALDGLELVAEPGGFWRIAGRGAAQAVR